MITKRIIPCLDVRDGRVLKGGDGTQLQEASPVELAKFYSECGADELVFCDMTATRQQRKLFSHIVAEVAENVFIPLTVGGGVRGVEDFELALSCGADKVSVNSGAIANPALVREAAKKYGNQCVVLSVDIRRRGGKATVFSDGGSVDTGLDPIEWITRCVGEGVGEVLVNSMDRNGERIGFDIPLLREVCKAVNVPVIASGGAGNAQHFVSLFEELPEISAGLASSVFHFGELGIPELKRTLFKKGVFIRR